MKLKNNIGIITYHNAINFGAVLQTYALNKYISNNTKKCEVIDYYSEKIDFSYKLFNYKKIVNSIIGLKDNIIKAKKFNEFRKRYIIISDKKYNKSNINESNKYYNTFITGSDQVWNLDLNEDKNYYLDFVDEKINSKNSYAASFGNTQIIDRYADYIKKTLKNYKNITVREKTAKMALKEKLNIDSQDVLDPTLLLSSNEWDNICKKRVIREKYILLYLLHEQSAYKIAENLSKITGLKVYVINQSYKKKIKSKYIRNAGPQEFLSLIKNSEYVVTDSFHGTAFSIIYRKNLKVVLKKEKSYLNDRIISILNKFKLEKCIVNEKTTNDELISNIDYKKSEKFINEEIETSKRILNKIINE